MPRNCLVNPAWLKHNSYRYWLEQDKLKPSSVACSKLCLTSFDIRNMGESALKSHMKGTKHVNFSNKQPHVYRLKMTLNYWFVLSKRSRIRNLRIQKLHVVHDSAGHSKHIQPTVTTAATQRSVTITTKADVLLTELLWALKVCSAHYSHSSCESSDLLFRKMAPSLHVLHALK